MWWCIATRAPRWPRHARDALTTARFIGQGLGDSVALIHRWRFSGGHLMGCGRPRGPEAAVGGAIALIQDGDTITVDTKPAACSSST